MSDRISPGWNCVLSLFILVVSAYNSLEIHPLLGVFGGWAAGAMMTIAVHDDAYGRHSPDD